MLSIQEISLLHFKNYRKKKLVFNNRITAICGLNGSGKTNLLDAIYYLCFTKSYFSRIDSKIIKHGNEGMRIEANFLLNDIITHVVCIIRENNKKEFSSNGELYKKFSEHIGKFCCVLIAPDDVSLITGNSDERRKFVDTILSQYKTDYLQWLIDYNRILQHRNSYLKVAYEQQKFDESLLDTLDSQLSEKGKLIFTARVEFFKKFLTYIFESYKKIAQKDDAISISYESQLHDENFLNLLNQNRSRDIYMQRTGAGIHKDDVLFLMNNQPFKTWASQGQRKSLLFALKLAEFKILKEYKGLTPILLLDDVFEKLDETRMHYLLQYVCIEESGQIFITDTHAERMKLQLENIGVSFDLIEL